jgi:uncharacterized heparinase superfamily protein
MERKEIKKLVSEFIQIHFKSTGGWSYNLDMLSRTITNIICESSVVDPDRDDIINVMLTLKDTCDSIIGEITYEKQL